MTVRVRFAPSPTGLLHPGNARVALQNYLFAHKHDGHFLLRIDDTDTKRSKKEFIDFIIEDLDWLGITPDTIIYQSERLHMYHKACESLIQHNLLYPCYETPEELNRERLWQRKLGKPPIYSRAALKLTDQERKEKEASGLRPHWRFRLPDKEFGWNDLCKGEQRIHMSHTSDPIVMREDGSLTFLLASIVDDIAEGVTHIIRGDDHLSNSAIHLALEQALRQTATDSNLIFAHTTLLRSEDALLSKSSGSCSLRFLRSEGLFPENIRAYLLSLGLSQPLPAQATLEQCTSHFNLSNYSQSSPLFDLEQVRKKNADCLHTCPFEDLPNEYKEVCSQNLWACIHDNVQDLKDVILFAQAFSHPQTPLLKTQQKDILHIFYSEFVHTDAQTPWPNFFTEICLKHNLQKKLLLQTARLALTGLTFGPQIAKCISFLGHACALERIKTICEQNPL